MAAAQAGGEGLDGARKTLAVLTRGAHAWDGRGPVGVTAGAVELGNEAVPRDAVTATVREGRALWLRLRDRPDVVVKCRRTRDATRLYDALRDRPPPEPLPAEWRKVLAAESAAARRRWFGERDDDEVLRRLARRKGPWAGSGRVRVTGRHLRFEPEAGTPRSASRRTIGQVLVRGRVVWVRRVRAHDWLVRLGSAAAARQLQRDLADEP